MGGPPVKYAIMKTPDLIGAAADALRATNPDLAAELDIRAYRLSEVEYQAAPDRNDLTGQTPAQIMATVNAPSPAGAP
jgi:hypothetical protein